MAFKYFNVKNGLVTGNILLHAGNGVIAANTFNGSLSVTDSANLGNVGNIKITGGQANYVLRTDGTGNLSWVEQSGGGSQVAGSNTQVQFNNNGNFGGSNSFTFDSSNTLLTVNNFVATSSANLGNVANVKVTGGSNGYYLQTDGTGNLAWSSVATGITLTVDSFVGDGSNVQFTLTQTPENANYTIVSIGGVMQPKSAYTVVNNTLTFGSAPPETSPIEVTIFEAGGSSGGASEFNGNVTGNLNVAGTTFVTGDIIPTSNNIVNIGSPTNRFGTLYLAANTIDLGGTTISTTPTGELSFATSGGNFGITANTVNFLNTIATTAIAQGDPVKIDTSPGGANTQIQFNDTGDFSGSAGLTFNKTTQTLTANLLSGNGNGLSNINGANVSGAVANATYATSAGTVTTAAQPNITSVGTLTSLTVNGNISANNANITGNIIPTSNNIYSLGSANSYWKDAYIGPGSLYINGVKVLEESSNSIVISADLNQTVKVTSSGSGDVHLQTAGTGVIAIKGPLQIQAANYITSSNGGPIGFSNPINVDTLSSLSANTNLTISANGTGNIQLNDDVTITGNLIINGSGGNLSVTSLAVEDNIIDISAETTGVPVNNAGIRVIRGDEPAVQHRWNETTETWQITNDGATYLNIVGSNTTTGNANVGNIGATNGVFTNVSGNGSALTSIAGANVSGAVSFASTANSVALANVSGAGNIASINLNGNSSQVLYGNGVFAPASAPASYGNSNVATFLSSYGSNTITTTGNVSVGNLTASGISNLGSVSNVKITGGTANFVLRTDGAGNLSWVAQTSVPSNIPPNNQTAAYVLVASDVGKYINITTGGVTVPSGVFVSGDTFSIYNNSASSQTITQGVGVTIYQVGTATTGNRTLAQRGLATMLCVGSNEFVITGGGLT